MEAAAPRSAPEFCSEFFSDSVVLVRAPGESSSLLGQLVERFWQEFLMRLQSAEHGNTGERQRRFLRALGTNKREARALSNIFGEQWADEFLHHVFFDPNLVPAEKPTMAT